MKQFKTESKKLLDLMINSIYTNREIFLRELISNASDAIDKLVFEGLTNSSVQVDRSSLAIRVLADKDARTLTVTDDGLGMTADELDANLGTIARSGSEQFRAEHDLDGDEVDIIGRFGVGFYSSFMVAKKVRVISRAFGSNDVNVWESDGVRGYSVSPASDQEREAFRAHGTDVILYLRDSSDEDDTDSLLNEWRIKNLIRTYSNYVHHPIQMMVTEHRELPRPEDAGDDYTPQYENVVELQTVNSIKPIWEKRTDEVEQKDYDEFYMSSFHDFAAPARTFSFHAEGRMSYDALLFIPSVAPFDLYSKDYQKGLALYSSNVLIDEKCAELVPDHFNFVRGVVDSPDVTLNISRETLQKDAQLKAIARQVDKHIRAELTKMLTDDRPAYEAFFENFGRGIKYGIYASYGSLANDLAKYLLFYSAREQAMVTLDEYAAHMATDQDRIYYAAGDSRDRLEKLPATKAALAHGYDVLLCTQDVDEFMLQTMRGYEVQVVTAAPDADATADAETPTEVTADAAAETTTKFCEFTNVTAADLDVATEDEKRAAQESSESHKDLLDAMARALEGKVSSVTVAPGLGEVPAQVSAEGPISLEMERIMAAEPGMDEMPRASRVLQLNAEHPVFTKLADAHTSHNDARLELLTNVLYDQALLVNGLEVDDPVQFARNVCELM